MGTRYVLEKDWKSMAKLPVKVRFHCCLGRTNSVEPVARGNLAVLRQY